MSLTIPAVVEIANSTNTLTTVTNIMFGMVYWDWIANINRDWELLKNFRWLNIPYLLTRYSGVLLYLSYVLVDNLGTSAEGSCQSAWIATNVFSGVLYFSYNSIFYIRMIAVSNYNRILMVLFAIPPPIIAGYTIFAYYKTTSIAQNPLGFVSCFPTKEFSYNTAALFLTAVYDILVFFTTLTLLLRRPTASGIRWIIIRDNFLFFGLATAINITAAILFLTPVSYLVSTPVSQIAIALSIVLPCRAFLQLRFSGLGSGSVISSGARTGANSSRKQLNASGSFNAFSAPTISHSVVITHDPPASPSKLSVNRGDDIELSLPTHHHVGTAE